MNKNKKVDCLNKKAVRDDMAEVMDSNAIELWGCFELVKNKLLEYREAGGDTEFAENALEDIMVYAENSAYVNKPYVEERLNQYVKEREAAEKPMGGLMGKCLEVIKEREKEIDEFVFNPFGKKEFDDKDYPYETI